MITSFLIGINCHWSRIIATDTLVCSFHLKTNQFNHQKTFQKRLEQVYKNVQCKGWKCYIHSFQQQPSSDYVQFKGNIHQRVHRFLFNIRRNNVLYQLLVQLANRFPSKLKANQRFWCDHSSYNNNVIITWTISIKKNWRNYIFSYFFCRMELRNRKIMHCSATSITTNYLSSRKHWDRLI